MRRNRSVHWRLGGSLQLLRFMPCCGLFWSALLTLPHDARSQTSLAPQSTGQGARIGECDIPITSEEGEPTPKESAKLARYFTPTLHFAPGERDFPTIPMFTAFDGLRNFGGSDALPHDLERPEEAAPLLNDWSQELSWDKLYGESLRLDAIQKEEWIARLKEADSLERSNSLGVRELARLKRPPSPRTPAVVFYRVRKLKSKEVRELWRYLKSDPQAWRRFRMDRLLHRWSPEREKQKFLVIEYYLLLPERRRSRGS